MIEVTAAFHVLYFYYVSSTNEVRYSHELAPTFSRVYNTLSGFIQSSSNTVAIPITTELALSLGWTHWREAEQNLPLPLRTALKIMGVNQ